MNKHLIYILNILIIALPLAIFEIIVEKNGGWGSGWPKDRWYARPFAPNSALTRSLVLVMGIEPPLNYHMLMFAVVLPFALAAEYLSGVKNILLLLSSFVCINVVEDFLWFLLNWHFDSLGQLLRGPNGSIWWHKPWVKITSSHYLPTSYFIGLSLSLFLLALA